MTPSRLFSCAALLSMFAATALRAAEPSLADVIRDDFAFAADQDARMLAQIGAQPGFPRTFENGKLTLTHYNDWTSGFFAGELWFLFEQTGDAKWRTAAEKFTAGLEADKNNRKTHDVGFVLNSSFGNGLRLTGNPHYRDVMLTGAESLSTRFNPTVGAIKSWDGRKEWPYPVIIDNMMNLELMLWAAKAGDTPKYRDIAIAHADHTLLNHYRPDGSSYHVIGYDEATGKVTARQTHQGYADESAWSRGQAWGLYGFTMMYRGTHDPKYLAHANKIAAFLLHHPRMPADKVPYWDFDEPGIPNVPRDASAAAIMASALYELSGYVDASLGRTYTDYAEQQLRSLSSPAYRAKPGENGCFLIMHCVGHFPHHSEVDVPIAYADYYFLEALLRAKRHLEGVAVVPGAER